MVTPPQYLVNYGPSGEFGLFTAKEIYRRGDLVVVEGTRGQEGGSVLCPATTGHGQFLSRTPGGRILRLFSNTDRQIASRRKEQAGMILREAIRLAAELALPLEILEAHVSFDGSAASLLHLLAEPCDIRPFVAALSRKFDVTIILENLAEPAAPDGGCGKPGCGSGSCNTCGSGGCGTCGKGVAARDVGQLLADLTPTATSPGRLGLL